MRGAHRIIVQNKRIRYDFIIKRNITVIRGDSATGKTALVDMIRDYFENGSASAVELLCDKQCAVLEGRTWSGQLSEIKDSIVFIDEGNDFIMSDQFASVIQRTDNYYIIVTRESVPSLPYSVEEIYGIRSSGKYGTLKRVYNEFYHLYPPIVNKDVIEPELIITEDSNSGYQFFQKICENKGKITCISANGKSNIFACAVKIFDKQVLIIADGAAIGSEMEKLTKLTERYSNITLYLPESFEWLILKSGIIENRAIKPLLEHPEEWIESQEYFSWERFFTDQLIQNTKATYLRYTKKQLNSAYLQEKTAGKILSVMKGIEIRSE